MKEQQEHKWKSGEKSERVEKNFFYWIRNSDL